MKEMSNHYAIWAKRKLLLYTLILFIYLEPANPLNLLELGVPVSTALGTRAALSCRWQLGPQDVLYSVKWYKDGKEFFRHVPRDVEPRRRYPLPGVDVEDADSSGSQLVLSPATLETAGRYRCEVSGERPLFHTVSEHKDMAVVVLPEHGPVISGFHSKYRIGDKVRSNCTSGRSLPSTQLSWHVNGEPAPTDRYTPSYRSENALIVTTLSLDFDITETHFRNSMLKVKCLATITPVYWKSNEESAVQEKIRALHDIGTSSRRHRDEDTRADRVHADIANSSTSSFFARSFKTLQFFGVIFAKSLRKFLC